MDTQTQIFSRCLYFLCVVRGLFSSLNRSLSLTQFSSHSPSVFIIFYCRIVAKFTRSSVSRVTSFVRHHSFMAARLWTLWSINLSKRPIEKIAQSAHKHTFENKEIPEFSSICVWFVYVYISRAMDIADMYICVYDSDSVWSSFSPHQKDKHKYRPPDGKRSTIKSERNEWKTPEQQHRNEEKDSEKTYTWKSIKDLEQSPMATAYFQSLILLKR